MPYRAVLEANTSFNEKTLGRIGEALLRTEVDGVILRNQWNSMLQRKNPRAYRNPWEMIPIVHKWRIEEDGTITVLPIRESFCLSYISGNSRLCFDTISNPASGFSSQQTFAFSEFLDLLHISPCTLFPCPATTNCPVCRLSSSYYSSSGLP
jgi:hypothetical protein